MTDRSVDSLNKIGLLSKINKDKCPCLIDDYLPGALAGGVVFGAVWPPPLAAAAV
ncbi:MAG: hypothetical protein JWO03_3450 [Bacteroidetes bacterium]|nr:hypothetical protein [Bacteroidota bacterium]